MPNKIKPCDECGATGREPHLKGCNIGIMRSSMSKAAHASRQANVKKAVANRFNQVGLPAAIRPTKQMNIGRTKLYLLRRVVAEVLEGET